MKTFDANTYVIGYGYALSRGEAEYALREITDEFDKARIKYTRIPGRATISYRDDQAAWDAFKRVNNWKREHFALEFRAKQRLKELEATPGIEAKMDKVRIGRWVVRWRPRA